MTPAYFPESNSTFGPPADLGESQCGTIFAYIGKIEGGSVDGAQQVVVAWKPDARERAAIFSGAPIYLSVIGGLPPHYLSVTFKEATHPA